MLQLAFFSTLSLFATCAMSASWTSSPFSPASVPLAIRSPYLSAWLPQGAGNALNDQWPQFWAGAILGWAGYVSVDGTVYSFLGASNTTGVQKATQRSMNFTSTQSTFVLSAGPVDLTATFLSPVEPNDLVKQSMPFSYLAVTVAPTDENSHSVKVYTDISAEWASGDRSQTVNWTTTSGSFVTHQIQLATQSTYTEVKDQIQQGSTYYSVTGGGTDVTYQSGADTDVRGQFTSHGNLSNTQDTNFRAINNDFPVFGLAKDLGQVAGTTGPVVFAIGSVRDPAVEYIVANNGTQARSLYFWSQYSNASDAIEAFLQDYSGALQRANTFDSQVTSDASKISNDYSSLVQSSIRQTMGGVEITISKNGDGSFNTSDVLVFMKEISSDGNVNTVDVIYPAWPALLYLNPALGKYLLTGLFQYQATGQYPNKYSVHDLGASYPKALGHNDGKDEAMPVEECGNMLIMTLSHAQKTGDHSLLTTYGNLLSQWTQFLIMDSLIPAGQISTDDFQGPLANQTNLAIKGAVGIAAMSKIASLTGDSDTASNHMSTASTYASQIQSLAASSDKKHLTLAYGNDSSWGLAYNLYADQLLETNIFPASVYDMQTAWYGTVTTLYGVPLDTRSANTKSDWQMWTAAFMTDTSMRDTFITSVLNYASNGQNSVPFGDLYQTTNGVDGSFKARPVVGGHLALLISTSSPSSSQKKGGASSMRFGSSSFMMVTSAIIALGTLLH